MSLDGELHQRWLLQLQTWAANGHFVSAAVDSLQLKPGQATYQLNPYANRLAKGDTRDLPPIELLQGSTIYLNANWLESASNDQIIAVLNEELGQLFDAKMNNSEGVGDVGELFARFPRATQESFNLDQLRAIRSEQGEGFIETPDGTKSVKFATIT